MKNSISKISNGLYIFLIGFVSLWITLGFVNWSIVFQFLRLWPLFFIVVGINIIFSRTKFFFLKILSPFLVICAVFGVIYVAQDGNLFQQREIELYKINKEAVSLTKITDFSFDFSLGKLILTDSDFNLIDANLYEPIESGPKINFQEFEKENLCEISESFTSNYIFTPYDERHLWDIRIGKEFPVKIKTKTAMSENKFNISNLFVTDFILDTNFSSSEIKLGDSVRRVRINSVGSKINIAIPKEMGLKIYLNKFLISDNFEELGLDRNFKEYASKDYDNFKERVELDLNLKLSQLEIKFY